jgi:CheY-like chemotaxis protein
MADDKKILLADPDNEVMTTLKGVLEDSGFDSIISHDGASALNKALSEMPSVIVLSVALPTIDGIKLSQILRSNPRTENIPVIFLSESDIYIPHFQRHRDSLFIKPVNVDEVAARIYSIFDKFEKTLEVSREGKLIEGDLSEISLPDLLQMFSMNKKEGRLCITRWKDKGDIWLQDGNVIDAAIGEVVGEKALFRLLTWKRGNFKFLPAKVNVPHKINRAADNLIMEGLRQYDEWELLKDKFPPMDARLKVLIDLSTLPKGLRPITQEIFLLLEFYPKVSDIIDRNTFPDYEVMRTIMTLLTKGIIGITQEKGGNEERPILPKEELLKLKERFASRMNYKSDKELGKVLIFSHDNDKIRYVINAINILPEFHIHKEFLKEMGLNQYLGVAGHLQINESIQVTFIVVPVSEIFSPLWRPLSNSMLCGLTILNGEVERWDEINKIAGYFEGRLGKLIAFAIPEGEASGAKVREIKEHMNRKNDVMLFPVVKNDAEGVRTMISTILHSVIGAL